MRNCSFCLSTIGQKVIVAVTGLFMLVFVIAHLLGNLAIYSGQSATNDYAIFLRQFPKFLWSFRIALILAVVLHVWYTISLARLNQRARPQAYALKKSRKATLSSRTMLLTGLTVLAFVAYHLAHYTFGITNPEFNTLTDAQGRHDVYSMMVIGFSNPLIAAFYILANIFLGFHLSHGISSATRTLGVADANLYFRIRMIGIIIAALIAVLFISIPLAVQLGFLPLIN